MFFFNWSFSFILFFTFSLFFVFVFILFKLFNLNEINWKIFYVLLNFIGFFSLFFYFANDILYLISSGIQDILILKDPQEFTNLLVDVSLFFCFFILFLNVPLLVLTFFFNILRRNQILNILFFVTLYYYYLILAFVVLHLDLYTSSWDVFSYWKQAFFDFQPNLEYVFRSYKGEFKDIWLFLFFIVVFTALVFIFGIQFWNFYFFRYLIHFFFFLSNFYFFGGDTLFTDFIILGISFVSVEIFIFVSIFLFEIKKFKI